MHFRLGPWVIVGFWPQLGPPVRWGFSLLAHDRCTLGRLSLGGPTSHLLPTHHLKILALEDQPVAGLLLHAELKALGHEVDLVEDGTQAWIQFVTGGYRVVVSDWRMPGINGLDLCQMIRREGGSYVYFILISAQPLSAENRKTAREAGVDDFISKPVKPDELELRLHVAERILAMTAKISLLESQIPVCRYCRKVRVDAAHWVEFEKYLKEQHGSSISHGVCLECQERVIVPQLKEKGLGSLSISPLETQA